MNNKEYWNQDWTKMPFMVAAVCTSIMLLIFVLSWCLMFG